MAQLCTASSQFFECGGGGGSPNTLQGMGVEGVACTQVGDARIGWQAGRLKVTLVQRGRKFSGFNVDVAIVHLSRLFSYFRKRLVWNKGNIRIHMKFKHEK